MYLLDLFGSITYGLQLDTRMRENYITLEVKKPKLFILQNDFGINYAKIENVHFFW